MTPPPNATSVSPLLSDAWAAWNASYHEGNSEGLRAFSRALYQQAWHERIVLQLAKLDEQNARLDAILARYATTA